MFTILCYIIVVLCSFICFALEFILVYTHANMLHTHIKHHVNQYQGSVDNKSTKTNPRKVQ